MEQQLQVLIEFNKTEIDTQRLILKYFDMNCDNCAERFTSVEEAQYHYHTQHDIQNGYVKCCDRRYNSAQLVREHLLYHMNEQLFRCKLCEMELDTLTAFKKHAYKHSNEGVSRTERQCTECGKTFRAEGGLRLHMTQIHLFNGRNHMCFTKKI